MQVDVVRISTCTYALWDLVVTTMDELCICVVCQSYPAMNEPWVELLKANSDNGQTYYYY